MREQGEKDKWRAQEEPEKWAMGYKILCYFVSFHFGLYALWEFIVIQRHFRLFIPKNTGENAK